MHSIEIIVISDFICPWCWICYKNMSTAIEKSKLNDVVKIHYAPYELNPDMPKNGVDRREYRSHKFGFWERSQAMDRDATKTGQLAGLEFHFDRVTRKPNTRLAHRLMDYAQKNEHIVNANVLYENIFAMYFNAGKDIGSPEALTELAAHHGYAVSAYLSSNEGEQEIVAAGLKAANSGISAVPFFEIAGHSLSGAQPVSIFTEMLCSRIQSGF